MILCPAVKKLRKFLKDNDISQRAAGRQLHVSHVTTRAWLKGLLVPDKDRRKSIEVWTGGAVPATDWITRKERETAAEAASVVPFHSKKAG